MAMTSSKPYLIKALYEWINDNACTPFLLVNAMAPKVEVPEEHVDNGQIILNITPTAVQNLLMDNSAISFSARFGGVPREIFVPVYAVMGIYSKENGQGMMFDYEEPDPEPSSPEPEKNTNPSARPSLKLIK